MKTVQILEDEDLVLLRKVIPADPCKGCPDVMGCCGCNEGKRYSEEVKPYKDAGIYEIAKTIRTIADKTELLSKTHKEIDSLKASLPAEVLLEVYNEKTAGAQQMAAF